MPAGPKRGHRSSRRGLPLSSAPAVAPPDRRSSPDGHDRATETRPAPTRLRGAPASRSRQPRPPALGLAIAPTIVGVRRVLEVTGEIDVATAPALTAALEAALAASECEIWVDLTGVTFMDSSGLHALLAAQHRVQRDRRRLAIIAPAGPVRRVLELTALDRILAVVADRGSAHQRS